MRVIAALVCLALCVAGAALFLLGRINGWDGVEEIGAWMTAPLWLLMGAISVTAAAGLLLAGLLRLASAARDRMRR